MKCSFAIIIHNKKVLLLLRDDIPTIPEPNKWSLIGGVVESGETHEEGLIREVREETNITIKPEELKYLGKTKPTPNQDTAMYLIYVTDKQVQELKLGDEGQDVKFFSINEIEHIELTKNLVYAFRNTVMYNAFKKMLNGDTDVKLEGLELV